MNQRMNQAIEMIDQVLTSRIGKVLGPGVSLALTTKDRLIGTRTYGVANEDSREPVTDKTLFQIGSITKQFTAVACLRLMEKGQLDVRAPVTNYLPWFEIQSDFDIPITIHHLLTHTSGMVMMIDSIPSSWGQTWMLRETKLGNEPGQQFAYSNVGYNVLQCVIQSVTGQSFDASLRDLVFAPLGMAESYGEIRSELAPRMAKGHKYSAHDDRPVIRPAKQTVVNWYDLSEGCGSVVTTPSDLSAFLRMLLNGGISSDGSEFLAKDTYALMTEAHSVMDGFFQGTSQGYGVLIEQSQATNNHLRLIGGGENLGFEASMYGDLETGVGVIMFCNSYDVHWKETRWMLEVLNAAATEEDTPPWPHGDPKDQTEIGEGAEAYAGSYSTGEKSFRVTHEQGQLQFAYQDQSVLLHRIYGDCFIAPHPAFEQAMLTFGKDDEGQVVEAYHLGEWFRNERHTDLESYDYPAEWDSYVGQYRAFGYFVNSLRFFVRKGQMICQAYSGYGESPITDLGDGVFRVGGEGSPHYMEFGALANGRMLRCHTSGGTFYRVE